MVQDVIISLRRESQAFPRRGDLAPGLMGTGEVGAGGGGGAVSPANLRVTSLSSPIWGWGNPAPLPLPPSLPTERSHLHLLIEALKAGLGGGMM